MKDTFGDRMKLYEAAAESRLLPLLPTFARVDGRAFHRFTRGLDRPYDGCMQTAMLVTATRLAEETNACMVYTQSDEITFAWLSRSSKSQIWFDGRHSKMVSQIAALATLHFYRACVELLPSYADKLPTFDARVWQVPNQTEGANVFLWRELDATRNSISMAAHGVFGAKRLHGKSSNEKQAMLLSSGINWNDYPAFFKRGVYVQRRLTTRAFKDTDNLPEKHLARRNPGLVVERSEWVTLDMPPLATVINREDVIFKGVAPQVAADKEDQSRC